MARGAFDRRGSALEDEFFHRVDQELILRLKEKKQHQLEEDSLKRATGIADRQVLEELRKAEITPETLVAFSILPAVFVAWADGHVDTAERKAILRAAKEQGIFAVSPSHELLDSWLKSGLSEQLITVWKDFIHAVRPTISDTAFRELRHSALGRAEAISRAAGGFLGIASVSQAEKSALTELNEVFDDAIAAAGPADTDDE